MNHDPQSPGGRGPRARRLLHLLHALLHWLLGTGHANDTRPQPQAPEAPDTSRAKGEIDRWVDELHRAGALDEATLDVFERLIDDWTRQDHTVLEAHRLDQGQHYDRLRADAEAEISRRDLDRRRAQREHERALAALEAHRRALLTLPSRASDPGPTDPSGPDPETATAINDLTHEDQDWSERGAA